MFLNKTTKYALSVLAYMSGQPDSIFSAELLHKELNIPRRYLRLLLTDLSKHGFIASNRGRAGGFQLSSDAHLISVADVIDKLEGLSSYEKCFFGIENCRNSTPCAMHKAWSETRETLVNSLTNTSIHDLGKDSVIKF
jgi:Rrf2 family protein